MQKKIETKNKKRKGNFTVWVSNLNVKIGASPMVCCGPVAVAGLLHLFRPDTKASSPLLIKKAFSAFLFFLSKHLFILYSFKEIEI